MAIFNSYVKLPEGIFISLVLSCIWRLFHPKNWDDWGFCKALPHNRASGGSVLAINLWQKTTKWWVPTPYQSEMALISSQSTPRPSYSCPENISELPIHLLAVHRSRAATWRMDSWSHDWSLWRLSIWLVFIRLARFWGKTWGRAGLNISRYFWHIQVANQKAHAFACVVAGRTYPDLWDLKWRWPVTQDAWILGWHRIQGGAIKEVDKRDVYQPGARVPPSNGGSGGVWPWSPILRLTPSR